MPEPIKRVYVDPTVDPAPWAIPLERNGVDLVLLKESAPAIPAAGGSPLSEALSFSGGGPGLSDAEETPVDSKVADLAHLMEDQLAVVIGRPDFLLQLVSSGDGLIQLPFVAFLTAGEGQAPRQAYNLGPRYLDHLQSPVPPEYLLFSLRRAFRYLILERENEILKLEIRGASSKVAELNRIGVALSAERDSDHLLNMILSKSREITSADAGSLYLVEEDPETGKDRLRFKLSQNDSINLDYTEFTLPINTKSLAGYTAATGEVLNIEDVYTLDGSTGFTFNRSFDEKIGYRTRSMVVVPMRNHRDEIIGVLQLINRKRAPNLKLSPANTVERTISFDQETQELVLSLGSQAAVAVQTNQMLENIQALFEGFVGASVQAIEQRDPATGGHGPRVAILTVGLAQAVDEVTAGPYKDISFSRDQIREIRYASILHDFGKVGVREHVLVKAKKLYEDRLQLIQWRFAFAKLRTKYEHLARQFDFVLEQGKDAWLKDKARFDEEGARELEELDLFLDTIVTASVPPIVRRTPEEMEKEIEILKEVSQRTYEDIFGAPQPLLLEDEFRDLCIQKGSLNNDERIEIESHVTHSFHFLEKIPWTPEMRNIPEIAYGHHEKLDGSGYPRGLRSEEINLGSKMMTISDIYDALTASDRPYKSAVPAGRALQILGFEEKDGHIEPELLRLFIERKVYLKTEKAG